MKGENANTLNLLANNLSQIDERQIVLRPMDYEIGTVQQVFVPKDRKVRKRLFFYQIKMLFAKKLDNFLSDDFSQSNFDKTIEESEKSIVEVQKIFDGLEQLLLEIEDQQEEQASID